MPEAHAPDFRQNEADIELTRHSAEPEPLVMASFKGHNLAEAVCPLDQATRTPARDAERE